MQTFLKLLPIHNMDENRQRLIWKAHIALILLFAERNQDISTVSNPLLDMVENCANYSDRLHLMRIFSEGFQDLIDRTTNLELGQYMFIGKLRSVLQGPFQDLNSGSPATEAGIIPRDQRRPPSPHVLSRLMINCSHDLNLLLKTRGIFH